MLKKKTSGCHEIHTSVEQILEFKEMKRGAQEGGKGMATDRNRSLSLAPKSYSGIGTNNQKKNNNKVYITWKNALFFAGYVVT